METIQTETWGQPSIYTCRLQDGGGYLYAIPLDDFFGELASSNQPTGTSVILSQEDIEDVGAYDRTVNEPVAPWKDIREDLAKDGVI